MAKDVLIQTTWIVDDPRKRVISVTAVFERPLILRTKPLHLLASAFSQTGIVLTRSACMDFESATVRCFARILAPPLIWDRYHRPFIGDGSTVCGHIAPWDWGLGTGYIMHG